jgi:hypothetical protein
VQCPTSAGAFFSCPEPTLLMVLGVHASPGASANTSQRKQLGVRLNIRLGLHHLEEYV